MSKGMARLLRDLKKSKTAWLALVVILGGIEEWARDPSVTGRQALGVVAAGLALLFMRHAVEKSGPPAMVVTSTATSTNLSAAKWATITGDVTGTGSDSVPEKKEPGK